MPEALVQVPAWWRREPDRAHELLRLAGEVEPEQPGLASQLRGIAMHEASVAGKHAPASHSAWWQRIRHGALLLLQDVGRRRAERELLASARRWEGLQPELAKELRAACDRGRSGD